MQMKMNFRRVFTCFLVLWPVLDTYVFIPGISIGEMLVLLSCMCCVLVYGKLKFDRVKYFYLYALMITGIGVMFNIGGITDIYMKNIFSYVLYAVILFCSLFFIDKDVFIETYLKVSKWICYLSLVQYFLLMFGVKFVEIFPGIPNVLDLSYSELQAYLLRMCGPFTEPAHLVQFLAVGLVILTFRVRNNNRLLLLHIITVCLTLSGNGLVLVSVIVGIRILSDLKERNRQRFTVAVGVVIVLSITLVCAYICVPEFRRLLMRVSEITGNSNVEVLGYVSASGYFRIKYGFDIFINTPFFNQIFGLGAGAFSVIYNTYDVVPSSLFGVYNSSLLLYRSGFTTVLIDFGMIGIMMYLVYLFRKRSIQSKQIALVLIALQLISSVINTSIWIAFVLLVVLVDDKRTFCKQKTNRA